MPAYNAEQYIRSALDSILNQTYKDFECIIVDDCSSDRTAGIIREAAESDSRIVTIRNSQQLGCAGSLNVGLAQARGEYIARMDSDDIALPQRFERQLSIMEEHDIDVCGSDIICIDEDDRPIGRCTYSSRAIAETIIIESPFAHPTTMIRKKLFDQYGSYLPEFTTAEDYDLWLRFWSHGARFQVINEELLLYRIHAQSTKIAQTHETIRTVLKIKRHARKYYGIRFGMRGWSRMGAEALLLCLPRSWILALFDSYLNRYRNT